jgi:aspartyl-tRNA(Asn)/glutamyl-tRNA(Gln) amidotransferase subunit C
MRLSPEDIAHIAKLSRLAVTEEEAALFQEQLSSILGYVAALDAVDTDGVEPMAQAIAMHNVMREDIAQPSTSATHDALLAAFPEKAADGSLKVKAVFS